MRGDNDIVTFGEGFADGSSSVPRALLRDGRMFDVALHDERMTWGEVEAAMRDAGYSSPDRIALLTLESDGSTSAVAQAED